MSASFNIWPFFLFKVIVLAFFSHKFYPGAVVVGGFDPSSRKYVRSRESSVFLLCSINFSAQKPIGYRF